MTPMKKLLEEWLAAALKRKPVPELVKDSNGKNPVRS